MSSNKQQNQKIVSAGKPLSEIVETKGDKEEKDKKDMADIAQKQVEFLKKKDLEINLAANAQNEKEYKILCSQLGDVILKKESLLTKESNIRTNLKRVVENANRFKGTLEK